ncbi:MAG: hypothetical protein QM770_14400 [Tepidisphaeraceae bacterium]
MDAHLSVPGEAVLRFDEAKPAPGDSERRGAWRGAYGVRFEVELSDDRAVALDVTLLAPNEGVAAHTQVKGRGVHSVLLPWTCFEFRRAFDGFLNEVQGVKIAVNGADGSTGQITLRKPALVRGENVSLSTERRGKSVGAGESAEYDVLVGNPTDAPAVVTFRFDAPGYEAMTPTVEPATLELEPGESKPVHVSVAVPKRIPPGGQERQTLRALGNGKLGADDKLEFITAVCVPHPNILHTAAGWADIRSKVQKYDWAKKAQDGYVQQSDRWTVPDIHSQTPKRGDWLFATQVENDLLAASYSYQLTLERKHAEKVRTFLLRLSDPVTGFPITRRGCNQASVQEGHFFQHIAQSYDMTLPSDVYTDADRAQIERTLRLFAGDGENGFGGQISNWNVSSLIGGLYCSLALQDLAAADRYLWAPGGIVDQFRHGTLDDGWWYEVSVSYNTWVATEFSQVALAMRPWGMDLANTQFPASFRPAQERVPEKTEYGMTDAKWGPIHSNSIGLKRMWDILPVMSDYKGTMFGINDTTEKPIGGKAMEIAYYLYRDPAYATVIRRGGEARDLLYGVPELPENTPDQSADSVFKDNAGVAVLRSQTADRPRREQIQAVLRYGDHGWYHGHFDRCDLLHLSRYGRSYWNPECIWFGYPSYLYKFFVQTSVNKSMVVVDQKQQEPAECNRILFHSGAMMQAAAVQTTARWSNPPYGGIAYDDGPKTFAEKMWQEGRSVPIPENAPPYQKVGSITGYSEPIVQRRRWL